MAVQVVIPQVGESVTTVIVARWRVASGDVVTLGQPLLDIDSDKASMEVPSPAAGRVGALLVGEGDEVAVGAPITTVEEGAKAAETPTAKPASPETPAAQAAAPAAPPAAAAAAAPPAAKTVEAEGPAKAGPAARAAASQSGVKLDGVNGTGKGGRVTTADVSQAAAQGGVSHPAPPAPVAARAPAPGPAGEVTRTKMSPLRRTIARRLVEAQQTAAMLTTFNEIDMSAVMELRKRHQDRFVERHGIKLGFMSFFVKATIEALKAFPAVNAEIDGDDVVYKHFYHLGVAVSGPKGLVVPVIRDADRLSFAQTEAAIGDLAKKARDSKLVPDDFAGGTFTISNGGVFGSMMSTPILNPPQVGILGMHNIVDRAVVKDGQIVIRPIMYVALSYDHRLIDGREAVSFLVRIKECVESPERLLIEA